MRTSKILEWYILLLGVTSGVSACDCNFNNFNCFFTPTAFDGCCKRIALEWTGPRVALTAFCPTAYPDSFWTPSYQYSRLYLDEISRFDGDVFSWLPSTWTSNQSLAAPNNLTNACNTSSFHLEGSVLHGACKSQTTVEQELISLVRSAGGILEYLPMLHYGNFVQGAFNQTCNDILFDNKTLWLEANCSTNPYGLPDKREEWKRTSLFIPDCLSRNPGLGNVNLTTLREEIMNRTKTCHLKTLPCPEEATLQFTCGYDAWNKTLSLPDFVWNANGTLGCYDMLGTNTSTALVANSTTTTTHLQRRHVRATIHAGAPYIPELGKGYFLDTRD